VPFGATVLLVDGYQDPFFDAPPLEGYISALTGVGVSFDIWDVAEQGNPSLQVMKPYRAVIWRLPEFTAGWTVADLNSISNYLASGGGLFVASMEVTSRVSETGGANALRDVLKVQSYLTDETGSTGAGQIIGMPNDPVGNGIDTVMDYTVRELWAGFLGPDLSDTITPVPGAVSVLQNDAGDTVGLRWPANTEEALGRLVLFTFPFDAYLE
jgi:hypothetical protein